MAYLEELLPEFRKGAKIRKSGWAKDEYIQLSYEDNNIIDCLYNKYEFWIDDFEDDNWELYQEPIDWDYIIKNKCLCWFWCKDEEEKKVAGLLADYDSWESQFGRYKGKNVAVTYFDHCRPVRRDEVNFYEDKKDV
jgi:hypothetical protein